MNDRQLIADLLSALEYHTEQTRPIQFSKVAIEAAREYLRKPAPAQRKPLTDEVVADLWSWSQSKQAESAARTQQHAFARAIERAHGIVSTEDEGELK